MVDNLAALAGSLTTSGAEAITVLDVGTVNAADLLTLELATSGTIDALAATPISGSMVDNLAALAGSLTTSGAEAITVLDVGTVNAADLLTLELATSGTIDA